ncbi:MAG: hypothetical protein O3B73_11415 [bacterium]|nr:hypothetical protein [bacterium]
MFSGDQVISKIDLLKGLPPEWPEDLSAPLRRRIQNRSRKLVVLDDDPTGAQALHSAPVLTRWRSEVLHSAMRSASALFFIVSNTRSLPTNEAVAVTREIASAVACAADESGVHIDILVWGDSTLRGHFPHELNAVREILEVRGQHHDGVILCPCFFEGGRLTAYDVQWVTEAENLVPAGQTEYARDRVFGYTQSNIRHWVAEKTSGRISADAVFSVPLDVIRNQGPRGVCQALMRVHQGQPVVVNATSYRDLEVFTSGLLDAEDAGKRFLFRTAASFLKVRSGAVPRGLLRGTDFGISDGRGGLLIVGSYMEKATGQLHAALARDNAIGIELHVARILDSDRKDEETARIRRKIEEGLLADKDVIVYTSRNRDLAGDLNAGRQIGASLVEIVGRLSVGPRYVIVKGGNTAITVVRDGLQADEAWALGQILPGVPVWKLGPESRLPGTPCVVFPGNVGSDNGLAETICILREACNEI